MNPLRVYIITGLSGSGKTTAMRAFEDACFYCVDNMPMTLVPKFLELPLRRNQEYKGIAFIMDMRSKTFMQDFTPGIQEITELGFSPRIIFLEASVESLVKRFSQTRRLHPLDQEGNSLLDSIETEIQAMSPIKKAAHHTIDTSLYSVHELKSNILDLLRQENIPDHPMKLHILSFGFKYGIPKDADLLVDVRFLANPYFIPALKHQTGESMPVREYVLGQPESKIFIEKYTQLLDFLIPLYKKENKAYLTIAVGCTGGRHRSVAIARSIFNHINKKESYASIAHRDIDRDTKEPCQES